jgi:hypothetical protein
MNQRPQTLFNSAVQYLDYENVKKFINNTNVDIHEGNDLAWKFIILNNDFNLFNLFLKETDINPNTQSNYALYNCIKFSHQEILKVLLEDKRVDPTIDGFCAIYKALEYKNNTVIHLLLNHKSIRTDLKKEDLNLYNKLMKINNEKKINNF